jgi:hypothetical protein
VALLSRTLAAREQLEAVSSRAAISRGESCATRAAASSPKPACAGTPSAWETAAATCSGALCLASSARRTPSGIREPAARELEREPTLARAPDAGEREEAGLLEHALAEVLEGNVELPDDLLVRCPGERHAAVRRQRLDPCRHVDGVSGDAIALRDYVADVDADAQLEPLPGGQRLVAQRETSLRLDGAGHSLDRDAVGYSLLMAADEAAALR